MTPTYLTMGYTTVIACFSGGKGRQQQQIDYWTAITSAATQSSTDDTGLTTFLTSMSLATKTSPTDNAIGKIIPNDCQ